MPAISGKIADPIVFRILLMNKVIQCLSPVDGSLYAERISTSQKELAVKVAEAKKAQQTWQQTSIAERAALCHKAVDAMLAMESEIITELAWQMGRPVRYGAGELSGFAQRARHMIDIAETSLVDITPTAEAGFTRFIRREPLGLVFVIAPWNYPYLTAVNAIIPALMAGNAVILKHAAQTMLVAERFQKAFDTAGLPEALFQHVFLTHQQTSALIASGEVNQINFTGSVDAGKDIEKAAAGTFSNVGLELGGKDPAYVRPDADIEHAIENIVDGAFFNSGQSCCGIERIYVHQDRYDEFLEGAINLASQYVLGNPLDEATTLGPMVKTNAADFVRRQIQRAVASGAITHLDQSAMGDKPGTPYMTPQILSNVDHTMNLMMEESFGPVVGIMKVADDAEALSLMNDSPYGLSASIWTKDVEAAMHLGERLETGTVFMNRADYLDPALTWTGVKNTGRGATLSSVGYEMMTRPKSFHFRH